MELDHEALEDLERGIYTFTSKRAHDARISWWARRAQSRGLQPFPITLPKLRLAGALLKQGKYRSSSQYLYSLKKAHTAQGGRWTTMMAIVFRDVKRSCDRGLGPPRQADALPLAALSATGSYAGGVLANATAAILTGAWWMLREIELANLTGADVSICAGRGCGVAAVLVSASKTDWRAKGLTRRHGCACPSILCPVRAVRTLLRDAAARNAMDGPLVLSRDGRGATKQHVEREIKGFARHLGASGHFTGHSLRVTGAQRLAMAGVSEDKIRTFGRWTGHTMLRYVRDTLLAYAGVEMAKQVVAMDALSAGGGVGPPAAAANVDSTFTSDSPRPPPSSSSSPSTAAGGAASSSAGELVTVVTSTEGVAHRWATDLHTVCGWAWFVAQATKSQGVPTCRRCLGTSVRWANRRG